MLSTMLQFFNNATTVHYHIQDSGNCSISYSRELLEHRCLYFLVVAYLWRQHCPEVHYAHWQPYPARRSLRRVFASLTTTVHCFGRSRSSRLDCGRYLSVYLFVHFFWSTATIARPLFSRLQASKYQHLSTESNRCDPDYTVILISVPIQGR